EIDAGWLAAWLADPSAQRPHTPMPAPGGGLQPLEVAHLAAFLRKLAPQPRAPTNEVKMALNVADLPRGRLIFRSAGCLGCHTKRDDQTAERAGERAAPDLAGLGRKRTAAWVASALEHPKNDKSASLSRHRPDMKLL